MFTGHLLGKPHDGTMDRHLGRRWCGFAEQLRNFFVTHAPLTSRDNRLLILGSEACQRSLVPLDRFDADHAFEGRGFETRLIAVKQVRSGPPLYTAPLVEDPVHQRTAKIRLERPFMARLEHRDVLERVHQDFLNDVAGVEGPARARR
jgi:hypothetical protein